MKLTSTSVEGGYKNRQGRRKGSVYMNNLSLTGWMDEVNPVNGKTKNERKRKTGGNRVSGMDEQNRIE